MKARRRKMDNGHDTVDFLDIKRFDTIVVSIKGEGGREEKGGEEGKNDCLEHEQTTGSRCQGQDMIQ